MAWCTMQIGGSSSIATPRKAIQAKMTHGACTTARDLRSADHSAMGYQVDVEVIDVFGRYYALHHPLHVFGCCFKRRQAEAA